MLALLAFIFDSLLALVVVLSCCLLCDWLEEHRRKKAQIKAHQSPHRNVIPLRAHPRYPTE
jgi:hypothetical protein